MANDKTVPEGATRGNATKKIPTKIGLALSGGGFRASIFHLGVIRRLEELGIMKDVDVISTVSGGSIIGAYYVCEMEKRLRKHRDELQSDPSSLDKIRLHVFEEIAEDFFHALRHNMRSRALLFSPFFHPILFIKSLWPGVSRSDIIQKEYDVHLFGGSSLFYTGETVGDLPSVTSGRSGADSYLVGPELVINATSLLTGERVSMSRRRLSGISEMKKSNANVLPLARAVAASACVPGLFPPTMICGDLLVDGGVSDNQGIDGLLKEGLGEGEEYRLIIVSDASGQIAQADRVSPKSMSVLSRSMSIFQHEIRNMEIQKLVDWKTKANLELGIKDDASAKVAFAFVHLFLDLKGRVASHCRVPSEYIPPLGRIRTDLDQFSMVEREALMYHAYTLIDAQLSRHCEYFLENREFDAEHLPALRQPPLFSESSSATRTTSGESDSSSAKLDRIKIKRELVAGAKPLFVLRSVIKYPIKAGVLVAATWFIPISLYFATVYGAVSEWADAQGGAAVSTYWNDTAPSWLRVGAQWFGDFLTFPLTAKGVVVGGALILLFYTLAFITYSVMRQYVWIWDQNRYRSLTGLSYSVRWGE